MAELVTWCTSRLAILKWLQILCALVAVLFLIDGRFQWKLYTFIFVACIVLAALSFLTLALYFFRVHSQNKQLPWVQTEIAFNSVAVVVCLLTCGILIYDLANLANGHHNHHRYTAPANIGNDGWFNRVIVVLATQVLNTVFYLASLVRTKRYGIK
ncbi:unnamed protein product [Bursaphelenchus xylophilus]|uniref:(pine wood nematode) hypothetical protein n=1 Tax=Bursaphelenchus xylophilus TaxID=6326 RepID=A0A1I7SU14_BURXY|nr:unnamed protein product [Bursaphelenchus xylophilus]CAG9107698.1 unnamed protein product [Bursaphelenchus xylophilus]